MDDTGTATRWMSEKSRWRRVEVEMTSYLLFYEVI